VFHSEREDACQSVWLGDEQWSLIQPLLPTGVRDKDRIDDWRVISSIVHVIKRLPLKRLACRVWPVEDGL
jgi:transposase